MAAAQGGSPMRSIILVVQGGERPWSERVLGTVSAALSHSHQLSHTHTNHPMLLSYMLTPHTCFCPSYIRTFISLYLSYLIPHIIRPRLRSHARRTHFLQ